MDDLSKHPRLTKRGNRYWFRAKIPTDLRSHFAPERERTFTLGTADWREAVEKVRVEAVKFDQEMAEARRKIAAAPVTTIGDTEVDRLAAIWLSDVLEEDEESRRDGLTERHFAKLADTLDIVDLGGRAALARGDGKSVEFEVDDLLDRNGVKLDKTSEAYRKLTYAILKASVRATEAMQKRHQGNVVDTPAPPVATAAPPNGDQGEPLSALIVAYLADPGRMRTLRLCLLRFRLEDEVIASKRMTR